MTAEAQTFPERFIAVALPPEATLADALEGMLYDVAAVVTKVIKQVDLLRSGKDEWSKASSGDFLYNSDAVKTGEQSQAVVIFSNGTQLKIDQKTQFEISDSEFSLQQEGKDTIRIKIGQMFFKTKARADKQKVGFEVETPVAVVSVRGTAGNIEVPDDKTSIFILESGIMEYKALFGAKGSGQLKPGQSAQIGSDGKIDIVDVNKEELKKKLDWSQKLKVKKKKLKIKYKNKEGKEERVIINLEK